MSETTFDKEQQVFSDHSIKIGAGSEKDFKQMALKNHSDMINGVDEKQRRKDSEMMQSYAEMARDQLNKFHDRLAIRLDGLSVSSATARKAATFFLDNFESIADRHNLSADDRQAARDDFYLLENGSEIQQQEAFDRIKERNPELAKDYTEIADKLEQNPDYNVASDPIFSSSSEHSNDSFGSEPNAFSKFELH